MGFSSIYKLGRRTQDGTVHVVVTARLEDEATSDMVVLRESLGSLLEKGAASEAISTCGPNIQAIYAYEMSGKPSYTIRVGSPVVCMSIVLT